MLLYNNNNIDREENMSGIIPLSSIHIGFQMSDEAKGGERVLKSLKC